jgi:hypothetical protein
MPLNNRFMFVYQHLHINLINKLLIFNYFISGNTNFDFVDGAA